MKDRWPNDDEHLKGDPAPELEEWLVESRRQWREAETKWRKARADYSSAVLLARAAFLAAIPERAPQVIQELQDVHAIDPDFFKRHVAHDYRAGRRHMKRFAAELDRRFEDWLKRHGLTTTRDDWMPRVAFQTLSAWAASGPSDYFNYWHDALDPETSLDAQEERRSGQRDDFLWLEFSAQWRPDLETKRDFLSRARVEFEQRLDYHVRTTEGFENQKAVSKGAWRASEFRTTKDDLERKIYSPHKRKLKQQAGWVVERHFLSKTFDQIAMDAATSERVDPDNVRKRARDFFVLIGLIEPDKM
jgi:hypothetical protein